MKKFNRAFFREMWSLTRSYWYSEEKWYARGLLAVIIGLTLGQVYLAVLYTEWFNTFYNALQNYDLDGCWRGVSLFAVLAFFNIVVAVYKIYLQQMLNIRWRKWLTRRYLGSWLGERTYYRMQLLGNNTDNPDQRISEDLNLFAVSTLNLGLGLLKAVVTICSFIFILWRLSGDLVIPLGEFRLSVPGHLVWVTIAYSIIGTWLTVKIGRPLIDLNFNQQRFEADFRFSMVRFRENSESIAFYGGEREENVNFVARFQKVFTNYWNIMRRQKQLTWFTAGYSQTAVLFPLLLALPRYFSRELQLGALLQISKAFGEVQDALSFIVDSYTSIAEWRAVVDRLLGFVSNMENVQVLSTNKEQIRIEDSSDGIFTITALNVGLPNGEILLKQLSLKLRRGDSLLVVGPSGVGKSTLLRSLAGLWPFGGGTIGIPQGQSILFLPQKSYLPLGTLREVLLYPSVTESVTDEEIKNIMVACKLEGLTGCLYQTDDWSHILSMGEQQRIAFARALLKKPVWLFLDEATSALDEATERTLYKLLQECLQNSAIVSVGHRSTLTSYHKSKLTIEGTGKWSFLK